MKPSKTNDLIFILLYINHVILPALLIGTIINAWFTPSDQIYIIYVIIALAIIMAADIITVIFMYFDVSQRELPEEEKDFWKSLIPRMILIPSAASPVFYYYVVVKRSLSKNEVTPVKSPAYTGSPNLLKFLRKLTLLSFYVPVFLIVASGITALVAVLTVKGFDLLGLILRPIIFLIPLFFINISVFYTFCIWDYMNRGLWDIQTFIYYFGQLHSPSGVFKYYKQCIKSQNNRRNN